MMILEQTFPVYFSITGIITLVVILFTIEFYVYKREIIHSLYVIPSVILLGPKFSGKTSMIKEITNREAVPHAKDDRFHVSYLGEGKKIQIVEPQNFNANDSRFLKSIKNMNYKSHIYVFDVSPFSDSIEKQIKEFNKIQNLLGRNSIIVANKTDILDHEKLRKVKNNFKNIHEISMVHKTGLEQLKNSIFSSVDN